MANNQQLYFIFDCCVNKDIISLTHSTDYIPEPDISNTDSDISSKGLKRPSTDVSKQQNHKRRRENV